MIDGHVFLDQHTSIVHRRTHHLTAHRVQIPFKWQSSEISKLIISEAPRPVIGSSGKGTLVYPVSMVQRYINVHIFIDMCQSSQWIVLTEEVKSPVKSSWLILFHKRAVEIWPETWKDSSYNWTWVPFDLPLPHLDALNFVIVFKPNFILQWVFTPLSQKTLVFFLCLCSFENTIQSSSKTFLHILPQKCTYAKHILEQF